MPTLPNLYLIGFCDLLVDSSVSFNRCKMIGSFESKACEAWDFCLVMQAYLQISVGKQGESGKISKLMWLRFLINQEDTGQSLLNLHLSKNTIPLYH